MISSITLKTGQRGDATTKSFPVDGMAVFVGPNASGKSLLLREVHGAFSGTATELLVADFDIRWPSVEDVSTELEQLQKEHHQYANSSPTTLPDIPPGHVYRGYFDPIENRHLWDYINAESVKDIVLNHSDKRSFCRAYLNFRCIRLDGRTRFSVIEDRASGDTLAPPKNILQSLLVNDGARAKIREVVHAAFGTYFVIDPTGMTTLRIRLSHREPADLEQEQGLSERSRSFHREATHIQGASDGVQAFVGILCAIFSGDYKVILIDEPEAFLHPPLARRLGLELARLSRERGITVLASTHSADFLIGSMQAGIPVTVVRLEYKNGTSRAHGVDPATFRRFLRKPLLRSSNVISGLFYDGTIVTESDTDRVFYGEALHRIAEAEGNLPSVLVVNAQNKQTTREIIGPLRRFGVPAAAIVDIDIIKENWDSWMRAANVPANVIAGFSTIRARVAKAFDVKGLDMKQPNAVRLLEADDMRSAADLFDWLDSYGLFVVRDGELETWLPSLGISGKGTKWVTDILTRMGENPEDSAYVRPEPGDVWDFLRKIASWVQDPNRKGMPSE